MRELRTRATPRMLRASHWYVPLSWDRTSLILSRPDDFTSVLAFAIDPFIFVHTITGGGFPVAEQ